MKPFLYQDIFTHVEWDADAKSSPPGYIVLRVDQHSRKLIAKCKPETGDHPELINLLLDRCDYLGEHNVSEGQSGLSLQELGQVAIMLRREPDPTDKVYVNRFYVRDPWMDLNGRKQNTGYLDFDALGKGESGSTWWTF